MFTVATDKITAKTNILQKCSFNEFVADTLHNILRNQFLTSEADQFFRCFDFCSKAKSPQNQFIRENDQLMICNQQVTLKGHKTIVTK